MNTAESGMGVELREAPEAVRRQAAALPGPLRELVDRLRQKPPQVVVTCARGSSAHAATFGKHLIERTLGIPVAAAAPNISTVYHRPLALKDQLFLAISQSGRSPDLIETASLARSAGAVTAALVNDVESPLARASDIVLPISAGPEKAIAATKSFVASLAALLRLVATWTQDGTLTAAVDRLPDRLASASSLDWSAAVDLLADSDSLITIGRGPTLAIAREAALKLKETCDLHAEAFSGAEFVHGPIALVSARYPILMFMPTDQAAEGLLTLARNLDHKGANVLASTHAGAPGLPVVASDHPDTDAVCLIQSFYAFLGKLARSRGTDIDQPRHLQKVTRTR
jgi:glutamine---fructose-6-phosphate transaminase (isomerizing)